MDVTKRVLKNQDDEAKLIQDKLKIIGPKKKPEEMRLQSIQKVSINTDENSIIDK